LLDSWGGKPLTCIAKKSIEFRVTDEEWKRDTKKKERKRDYIYLDGAWEQGYVQWLVSTN
jgi:hypothetical protein